MKHILTAFLLLFVTSFAFSQRVDAIGQHKVKPGEQVTLTTGATIDNQSTKKGQDVKYGYTQVTDIETGDTKDIGEITVNDAATATITDVTSNEIININNSKAVVKVVGTGTTISLGNGHFNLDIENTGKENITVLLPRGGTLTVQPGSHITLVQ